MKGFDGISLFRLDDSQIAKSVGDAVLLIDCPFVQFSRSRISPFVREEGLLEWSQVRREIEDLRGRLRKQIQLVRVFGNFATAPFDTTVTWFGRLNRKF